MIGIKGQYAFSFSVGPLKDFINQGDLDSFRFIEESGNVLPTFELVFKTKIEKILGYLNEGNDLDLRFGMNIEGDDVVQVNLNITKMEVIRINQFERRINLVGIMSKMDYIITPRIRIIKEKSAVEAIKEVMGIHFSSKLIKGVSSSEDSQNWIQHNISDKKFVQDMVLHAKIDNSFPIIGINSQGQFIINSFKALGSNYTWNFIPGEGDNKKDYHYFGDYVFTSNNGFLNSIFGYGRDKKILDMESGLQNTETSDSQTIMALANTLSRRATIEKRYSEVGIKNANMDPDYWTTALNNLVNWAVFSSHKISLWVPNIYFKVSILDLAQFTERESTDKSKTSEYLAGLYIVTKVVRTISANTFATNVELSRESMNATRGDLR